MTEQKTISFEKETEQIDAAVKKKIANHLWMFCGYKDSELPAVNIDAKYIKAISDLYNVVIDSSIVTGLYRKIAHQYYKFKYMEDIDDIREVINTLRTVGSHTLSEENMGQNTIVAFKKWEKYQCGTDNPTKEEEFEKLIKGLLQLKDECFGIVNRFLTDAGDVTGKDKEKLIKDWEKAIIEYYLKTAHADMFKKKLTDLYKARKNIPADTGKIESNYASKKWTLENEVKEWVMNEVYLKEREIALLKKAKEEYYQKLTAEEVQAIQQKEEEVKKVQMEVAEFANKQNELETLTSDDYLNHYLSKKALRKKMRDAVPEIKNRGLTMMPDDLFDYIIKKDLGIPQ
jgi:hypothetical protein